MALANFYWATNRRPEVEQALKAALKIDAKHLLANRGLSTFYLVTGRTAEAEQPLKTLADADPNVTNRLALADYYLSTRRVPEAKAIYEQAPRIKTVWCPPA